ncbi:MAG: type II toxin-antitoxin system Phd/YefM family antitoxin [Betaproteobacteria bacterium]|nr:type II toxin-antitoxin system Phd/YefM family antitoxin [Betaproteobacteria bacterium]
MAQVNVTELRQHLPSYLDQVQGGEEIEVTLHGRLIARIVPAQDPRQAARARLAALRGRCVLGDVENPTGEAWEAELDRP